MAATKIEWAEHSVQCTYGCTKVSVGCANCYAERMAVRLAGMARGDRAAGRNPGRKAVYEQVVGSDGKWNGRIVYDLGALEKFAAASGKPRVVFLNSMSDLFHPDVPRAFQERVWHSMALASWLRFLVLTKRPGLMVRFLEARDCSGRLPLSNVGVGVTVENDEYTPRIYELGQTPAEMRFLSLEPLLGPLPNLDLDRIDWVIVGGESGLGARPMHPEWVRNVRDQCVCAGVPFFFKQWGVWSPDWAFVRATNVDLTTGCQRNPNESFGPRGLAVAGHNTMFCVGKKAAGRELDGRTWDEVPEMLRQGLCETHGVT